MAIEMSAAIGTAIVQLAITNRSAADELRSLSDGMLISSELCE